jgi:hypothetical protein
MPPSPLPSPSSPISTSPFPFLALPLELRESIYSLYFKPADRLVHNESLNVQGFFGGVYSFDFSLYLANRQLYKEAKAVWQRENVFVKIATPWPSAGMYRVYLMSEEGRDWGDEEEEGEGMGAGESNLLLLSRKAKTNKQTKQIHKRPRPKTDRFGVQ